ncbi:MAG TPA: D-aminoacyl-tRNA deacylase [Nannocystaceae bacterium]|nr:D-aminoacyl-tRNA deacylase [Nannocystaceae bacterium]
MQRVASARVDVDGATVGRIDHGLLAYVGVERDDTEEDAVATARKLAELRIFPGRTPMDRDVREVGGAALVVSQFTLAGSLRKGRRPSFDGAMQPDVARTLYDTVCVELRKLGLSVETGQFAAHMHVVADNDGPVTFVLATRAGVIV